MKKIFFILGLLLLFTAPWWLYLFKEKSVVETVVFDVSSTTAELENRKGIFEALNIHKVVNLNNDNYDANQDYFGVKVVDARESIHYNELPLRIDQADLIYLSDLSGIKESELSWGDPDSTRTLYGGLTGNDWRILKNRLNQTTPSTFIVEYNSFTETTDRAVRDELAEQLGIEQTGYEARYYEDLSDTALKDKMDGGGLLIRHKETGELTVLQSAEEVRFIPTQLGEQQFGFKEFSVYDGWFDLAIEKDAKALAYYSPELSDADKKKMKGLSLSGPFVAIANVKRNKSNHYYFAGKYSYQSQNSLPIPKFIGYSMINKWLHNEDTFYWEHYIPMMEKIVQETKHVEQQPVTVTSVEPIFEQNVAYNARVLGDRYEVLQDGQWKEMTIKGVNIGMAKPGLFPGEAGITKEDYAGWLKSIGEMNANAIRVYTIHPPAFYEALLEYNEAHEKPIYVFHGVWLEEEPVEEQLDVYGEPTEKFRKEIKDIIDLLHGNAKISHQPGHASGNYTANVAPYVIGWMIGIEWYPYAVHSVNEKYKGKAQFNGEYFSTKDAAPFEIWLAEQMEFAAQYEIEQYKWMRPFSFTNWVTTDLLDHPYEPSDQEDMASVNPNVIYEKDVLQKVGQFANYHVYPYYPDFLNYTPEYLQYKDHRGNPNSYAAYMNDLKKAHRLPILISEFGIPSSRGLTHKNPFGWNQGFVTERQQGEYLVSLYEDILHEGMLGGLVFSWQDEWFKRTWNTMDLDNPDARPYWSNAQTNEQQFGLLSFDTLKIKVDGDTTDWIDHVPMYENEQMKLFMDSDERYLYLRMDVEKPVFSNDYYPLIYFNTVTGQGNSSYKGYPLMSEADFVLSIKNEDARIEVDAYYDLFQKLYGERLELVPFEGAKQKNSGQFNPIEYALNKQLTIPVINKTYPFEKYETGKLRRGNGNPNSSNYDSLADYAINEADGIVEIRIPWLLMNVTDPSRQEVWSDLYEGEEMTRENIKGIEVGAMLIENNEVKMKVPENPEGLKSYTWKGWSVPEYKERLKESYYILQEKFSEIL